MSENQKPLSEDQIQANFYRTAYNTYPQIRGLLFSIPNGSTRHLLEAIKLKATGLTPGVSDMLLLWKGKAYGFEFKTTTGQLSQAQTKVQTIWRANGIEYGVYRSTEDAILRVGEIILT